MVLLSVFLVGTSTVAVVSFAFSFLLSPPLILTFISLYCLSILCATAASFSCKSEDTTEKPLITPRAPRSCDLCTFERWWSFFLPRAPLLRTCWVSGLLFVALLVLLWFNRPGLRSAWVMCAPAAPANSAGSAPVVPLEKASLPFCSYLMFISEPNCWWLSPVPPLGMCLVLVGMPWYFQPVLDFLLRSCFLPSD